MAAEKRLLAELTSTGTSQTAALTLIGLSKAALHYRRHPRPAVAEPIPHAQRQQPSAISAGERDRIVESLNAHEGIPVEQVYYLSLDDGEGGYVSLSTFHRIARAIERPSCRRRRRAGTPDSARRQAPDLTATGPGQVLCWDITVLPGQYRGQSFALYAVIDLFSRKVVGHTVQPREDHIVAAEWMGKVLDALGSRTRVVHSDNGGAMTSNKMKTLLGKRGVTQSLSRPAVSNDNPHIESWFRTVKYHQQYPHLFDDIDHAVRWCDGFIDYYNTCHKHSGVNGYAPQQVFDGSWRDIHARRQAKADQTFADHPLRFRRVPTVPAPPEQTRLAVTARQAPTATNTIEQLLVA